MTMDAKKKSWDFRAAVQTTANNLLADPLAKLVCLVLAVMLWMYIVGSAEVQFEFREVPVEFTNVAPDLAVSEDSQRHVSLRVSGPKASIDPMEPSDFKVNASLAGKREGEKWVVLALENVENPRPDVKVERIEPGSLRVFLERVEGRRLPIVAKLQGEAPAGYQVTAKARPETAMVLGPGSLFLRMTEISTEVIDIGGRRATFSVNVKLHRDLKSIRNIDPETVEVLVEIEENIAEKLIESVRIELQNPIPGRTVQIKPESVSVKLRGPQNVLDRLDASQLRVQVELPADKQFHLAVPRALNVPERVEVVSYEPALVRVSIPGQ